MWLVFVNHRKGLEYAGTVAAFTAPIIMIQDAESKQDKQTAALSRIEQTLVGSFSGHWLRRRVAPLPDTETIDLF